MRCGKFSGVHRDAAHRFDDNNKSRRPPLQRLFAEREETFFLLMFVYATMRNFMFFSFYWVSRGGKLCIDGAKLLALARQTYSTASVFSRQFLISQRRLLSDSVINIYKHFNPECQNMRIFKIILKTKRKRARRGSFEKYLTAQLNNFFPIIRNYFSSFFSGVPRRMPRRKSSVE